MSDSNIIPFRRKKEEPAPAPQSPPPCCSECGWKMPKEVRADLGALQNALSGDRLLLYIDCPECGASLFWMVQFQLDAALRKETTVTHSASRIANHNKLSAKFREWANGELDRTTPDGWKTKQVTPWSRDDANVCRSCRARADCAVTMLTHKDADSKTVRYVFVFVCADCVESQEKLKALGARVLAPA